MKIVIEFEGGFSGRGLPPKVYDIPDSSEVGQQVSGLLSQLKTEEPAAEKSMHSRARDSITMVMRVVEGTDSGLVLSQQDTSMGKPFADLLDTLSTVQGKPITVLMLDLGDTLERDNQVFSGIPEALQAIQQITAADSQPLQVCLVSDFFNASPPTESRITELFQQYLAILEQLGLRQFFEPVDEKVTLSTHAGVHKPDPRVFQLALERLGTSADFTNCLFITENSDHIDACKQLGIRTLQFVSSISNTGGQFDDWSQAPGLIAQLVQGSSG